MYIGLGHQSRVGKDTFADRMVEVKGPNCRKLSFAAPLKVMAEMVQGVLGIAPKKDPLLLQTLGMALRSCYGANLWCGIVRDEIRLLKQSVPGVSVVVTDVRFKNEFEMLRGEGFVLVKVVRADRPIDRDVSHRSETELTNVDFDFDVFNYGSLDEYLVEVDNILQFLDK